MADNNNLEVSPDKTNYTLFSRWAAGPSIYWKGDRMKQKHAIKYLVVHIDDKLDWSTHLQYQDTKAHQLQQNFLKTAGKSWGIKPRHRKVSHKTVIERMLCTWCLHPTVKIARIFSSIQRRFLLAITGAYRLFSSIQSVFCLAITGGLDDN
ncbi:hypothetical protein AVEN_175485-1 [Araneus ventricosus]|uniref:Uncharacterized protein n=1 Tax=Araneus ventricosus TaxID=182803 RepID=A0A4Y2W2L6_ARAVE|nr:hypothetical protein AVEN_175485-1 [Araneus ventricosus]